MYQPPPGKCVLKIRAIVRDVDYIEIEVDMADMTYESLVARCCQELRIEENQIYRIRRAPNVRVRSTADLLRFNTFESLEFVLRIVGNGMPYEGAYLVV